MNGHLRPTAPIAADALLPGDPGRALALAQDLLDSPRMSNHSGGLWGYGGQTADGRPLTVQATGIGGPSIAVVVEELSRHGVRCVVRLGSCRSEAHQPGQLLLASAARPLDGTSRALGAERSVEPDPGLTAALAACGDGRLAPAEVASGDLFYDEPGPSAGPRPPEAAAADLGTAPLLTLARRLGLAAAAILVVSESAGRTLADPEAEEVALIAGRIAAEALARAGATTRAWGQPASES